MVTISSRVGILKEVIVSPRKAFFEIGTNGSKFFPIAFVILLGTVISSPLLTYFAEYSWHYSFVEEPLSFDFASTFFEIQLGFVLGIGFAYLVYAIGKKLGGQGSFKGVFSSMCYASLPVAVVGTVILLPLFVGGFDLFYDFDSSFELTPFFSTFIILGLGVGIWGIVLSLLAIMQSHQIGFWRTIGTIFISAIIITIIYLPIGILTELYSEIPNFDLFDYDDPSTIRQQGLNDYVGLSHDPNRVVDVMWDAFSANNTGRFSVDTYTEYETPEELFGRFDTIMDELDRISRISDEMVVIDYLNDEISDLQNQTNILSFNDITKQKLLAILESAKQSSQISEMKALSISEDEVNEIIAQTEFFIDNYIDELDAITDISSKDVEILLTKAKQISADSRKRDTKTVELISGNSLFFTSKLIDQMKDYVYESRIIIQKMRDLGFDVTISAEHEDHETGIMETVFQTIPNTQSFENLQTNATQNQP